MKKILFSIYWKLLSRVKQWVDKAYYAKYDDANRDRLIRKAFPGITKELGYDKLNEYLMAYDVTHMRSLIRMLMSFYWAEVARVQSQEKYAEAERYRGIVDFCTALESYSEEASNINSQE